MKIRISQLPTEYILEFSELQLAYLEAMKNYPSIRNDYIQNELVLEIIARLEFEIIDEEKE